MRGKVRHLQTSFYQQVRGNAAEGAGVGERRNPFPFQQGHFREHLGERMEFVDGLQTDNSRLPACGIEDPIIVGHTSRVRHGGHSPLFGFANLIDQDRLAGFFGGLHELSAVGDILQIYADDFGLVVLKIIDHIRFINITLIADTDHLVDADQIVIKRFHDQDGHTAALDYVGDGARRLEDLIHLDQARVDAVKTAELVARAQRSQAVRPHYANVVGFTDLVDFVLHRLAEFSALGKTGALNDDALDAFLRAVPDDAGDIACRHNDYRQIGRFRKGQNRRITRVAVHRLSCGIHGIDGPGIAKVILQHVTNCGAEIEGGVGSADNNN